jgi:hypothetical protein
MPIARAALDHSAFPENVGHEFCLGRPSGFGHSAWSGRRPDVVALATGIVRFGSVIRDRLHRRRTFNDVRNAPESGPRPRRVHSVAMGHIQTFGWTFIHRDA